MKLVRFPDLAERFGVTFSRQHLGRLAKAGKFPAPVTIGARSVAWVEEELASYIAGAAAARPTPARAAS
jgi:prophage regulatory protein